MTITTMLVVCALDAGCVTRDGTTQPAGTAFDRVVTAAEDYAPGPGLAVIADDGRALYVQNSSPRSGPPRDADLPTYINDADAIAHNLPYGKYYSLSTGYVVQLKGP